MAGSLKNIGLTSLDDLFKTDEQRQADAQERVQIVPADQVFPYARQPYSIDRPTQDLAQLMDSIERVGSPTRAKHRSRQFPKLHRQTAPAIFPRLAM